MWNRKFKKPNMNIEILTTLLLSHQGSIFIKKKANFTDSLSFTEPNYYDYNINTF